MVLYEQKRLITYTEMTYVFKGISYYIHINFTRLSVFNLFIILFHFLPCIINCIYLQYANFYIRITRFI
jgi:hypothetical protein